MARTSRWLETSNVRLPLELRSDRHETSATRVSDDLQISIFWRQIVFFSEKNSDFFFGFSLFSVDFRGARVFLTSESSSSRFFALDGQIFRSVRPLAVPKTSKKRKKKKRIFLRFRNSVFHHFWQILEELGFFWHQNRVPRGFSL